MKSIRTSVLLVILIAMIAGLGGVLFTDKVRETMAIKAVRDMHLFLQEKYATDGYIKAREFQVVPTGLKAFNHNGQKATEMGQMYCDSQLVTVAIQPSVYDSLMTLGHEWIHVEQCLQNRIDEDNFKIQYTFRPHEVEARTRGIELVTEYLEHLEKEDDVSNRLGSTYESRAQIPLQQ